MPGFVRLASLADLPPGSGKEIEHDGRIYALFNVNGEISAIDGVCPHQGGPIAKGKVCDHVIACPWHGWPFDLRTGQSRVHGSVRLPVFAVQVDGDDILVDVP